MPLRIYVPTTWNGKDSLPILLFLHGAGANERTYLDMADGLLRKLAEQHGYIVVSPLGFTARLLRVTDREDSDSLRTFVSTRTSSASRSRRRPL